MYRKSLSYLKILVCAAFMMVTVSAVSPSAEAVVVESSGDGMCFYNAVFAPVLPSYRPSGYDYSFMVCQSPDGMDPFLDIICYLVYSDMPLVYDSDSGYLKASSANFSYVLYLCPMSDNISSLLGLNTGVWSLSYESTGPFIEFPSPFWSDYDIYSSDRSNVVSPASDLISLDGYNIIRWDGVREGYADSTVLYPVASYLDVPLSVYVIESTYSNYGNSFSYYSGVLSTDLTVSGSSWSSYNSDNHRIVFSDYDTDTLGFRSGRANLGFGRFTQYLAYKSAPDVPVGPDFTNTELTISNPEYDFQSANFDVSWSNLPNIPYPDSVQYYLTARLNDSSPATHPYTYIGSSDDPPSGDIPVWFQFDDLQPETAYTVTVELRYASGDNASFSNSVSSGVTATASFTTLSDGSISEGDKAIIGAIQDANKDNQQWLDSQMGSAVGDLNEDVAVAEQQINDLNNQEEAFKDDAFARFQEVSASFSGFDGTIGSGIGLAGTLFSRFFNCLGDYAIIYTFPLILGLAMVIIGRLSRSSFSLEDKDHDQFTIDGW